MDIEQFRKDFIRRVREDGRSVNSVANEYGIEQASLSRFVNGKGLAGETVIALLPFVYRKTLAFIATTEQSHDASYPLP